MHGWTEGADLRVLWSIEVVGYNEIMVAPANIAIENSSPDLSRLVDSARQGREIVITRAGEPVARIVAILSSKVRPKAGYGKGTVLSIADDFDEPLTDFDENP